MNKTEKNSNKRFYMNIIYKKSHMYEKMQK